MEYILNSKSSKEELIKIDSIIHNVDTIMIVNKDFSNHMYYNVHKVARDIVMSSEDVVQSYNIYFRSYKDQCDIRIYGSYIIDTTFGSCRLFIKDNALVIKLEDDAECLPLKLWERKIVSKSTSRSRITKEIAQMRIDDLGYDFTVSDWESTGKPVTIICNVCDCKISFKKGGSIYTVSEFGGFNGECTGCRRYKYALSNASRYRKKINDLINAYRDDKVCEEDFIDRRNNLCKCLDKELDIIQAYRDATGMVSDEAYNKFLEYMKKDMVSNES